MPALPSPRDARPAHAPTTPPSAPSSPSSGGVVAYRARSGTATGADMQQQQQQAVSSSGPGPGPQPPSSASRQQRGHIQPASEPVDGENSRPVRLELEDGAIYHGFSFGADKSIAGELVFQNGMVGYPEAITDPSYRGQIVVITFPQVGSYGVPSRETVDELLGNLPKHFESSRIHVSGLVVANYYGEDYSHFLAASSLGQWLKEEGVPAMHGVDTRALTKRIREEGSMLGRMMLQKPEADALVANGVDATEPDSWRASFEQIDWEDPNKRNLVNDGTDSPSSQKLAECFFV